MEPGSAHPPRPHSAATLLDRNTLGAIVQLALPTTGVMLIATLSNVLHTYFVSRLGAEAIAAVSLVLPITLVVITLMGGGLGTGVSSAIARALGAGRTAEAQEIAEHAFVLTTVFALVLTAGFQVALRPLFRIMGGQGNVLEMAVTFARVFFGGLLIQFAVSTLDSILRGEGNVRVSSWCSTLSLVLQIALTPLFMFTAGLGLVGAPLATLAGQFIGLIPRAWYVLGGKGTIRPRLAPKEFSHSHLGEILRVGVPASLGTIVNYSGLMVLTGVVAHFGTAHLAAYGLGTRLDFLLFTLGYGVASAALTLVGMASGAGRPDLIRRYANQAVVLVACVVIVPASVVVLWPQAWLALFTDDPDVLSVGASYLRIIGPSYLFMTAAMVFASAFQGLGIAATPMVLLLVRVVSVLSACLWITRGAGLGAEAVFAVVSLANVVFTLLLAFLFHRAVTAGRRRRDPV